MAQLKGGCEIQYLTARSAEVKQDTSRKLRRWRDGRYRMRTEDEGWRMMGG
jgi:hypothetical protein